MSPADNEGETMRFIITATTDETTPPKTEAAFDEKVFAAYMKFNEELHTAGVLIASEGLMPGTGVRVVAAGGKRKVVDGPFAESKELVGGFYIIEVPSLKDAEAWALRCPIGMDSANVLEIRQLTGSDDIPKPLLDLAASVAPQWVASITKGK
jgi:hypothetical protein